MLTYNLKSSLITIILMYFSCDLAGVDCAAIDPDFLNCKLKVPEFNCAGFTEQEHLQVLHRQPKNAQNLHPADISIIASMGDSITAGMFARPFPRNPLKLQVEHRGFSYSNGEYIDSIVNILENYHGYVVGASSKTTTVFTHFDGDSTNLAVTAASANTLLDQMKEFGSLLDVKQSSIWDKLKDVDWFPLSDNSTEGTGLNETAPSTMQGDGKFVKNQDPMEAWKLLNIWIGSTDICRNHTVEHFEYHVRDAMSYLYKNVKKVFVNLILTLPITPIYEVARNNTWCRKFQSFMDMCPPIFTDGPKAEAGRILMNLRRFQYNDVLKRIAKEYADRNNPEFMVAAQGGLVNLDLSNLENGGDFVSRIDCFHPNACAQRFIAFSIWNSLFSPLNEDLLVDPLKSKSWRCPTVHDRFQ